MGRTTIAWASDYPHAQSTFPNSHKIVDENFEGVSDDIKKKVTRDNVIKLVQYGPELSPSLSEGGTSYAKRI